MEKSNNGNGNGKGKPTVLGMLKGAVEDGAAMLVVITMLALGIASFVLLFYAAVCLLAFIDHSLLGLGASQPISVIISVTLLIFVGVVITSFGSQLWDYYMDYGWRKK